MLASHNKSHCEWRSWQLWTYCIKSTKIQVNEDTPEAEPLQQTESVLSSELHHTFKTPLYNASHITIFQRFLLIFQFAVSHSLTIKAFGKLLHLIAAHLPQTPKSPKSASQLRHMNSGTAHVASNSFIRTMTCATVKDVRQLSQHILSWHHWNSSWKNVCCLHSPLRFHVVAR